MVSLVGCNVEPSGEIEYGKTRGRGDIKGNLEYKYEGEIGNSFYEFDPCEIKWLVTPSYGGKYSFNTLTIKQGNKIIKLEDPCPNNSEPPVFERAYINGKKYEIWKKYKIRSIDDPIRQTLDKLNIRFRDVWGPNLKRKNLERKKQQQEKKRKERENTEKIINRL